MYGIEIQLKQASRVVRKKGRPLYSIPQTQGIATLKKDGCVVEVAVACDASTLVRELSKRFGLRELSWQEAAEVVRQME